MIIDLHLLKLFFIEFQFAYKFCLLFLSCTVLFLSLFSFTLGKLENITIHEFQKIFIRRLINFTYFWTSKSDIVWPRALLAIHFSLIVWRIQFLCSFLLRNLFFYLLMTRLFLSNCITKELRFNLYSEPRRVLLIVEGLWSGYVIVLVRGFYGGTTRVP